MCLDTNCIPMKMLCLCVLVMMFLSEKLISLLKTVIFVKEPQLPDGQILSWNSSLCTKMLGFTSKKWLMN